ncbi:MAG: hypothetical protein R3C55_15090 [Parvularculaceae bacterium]
MESRSLRTSRERVAAAVSVFEAKTAETPGLAVVRCRRRSSKPGLCPQ